MLFSIYHTSEFLKFWSSGYFQAPRPIPLSIPWIWYRNRQWVLKKENTYLQGAYIERLSNSNHSKGCKIQSLLLGFNKQGPLKISNVLKGEWNGVFQMKWPGLPLHFGLPSLSLPSCTPAGPLAFSQSSAFYMLSLALLSSTSPPSSSTSYPFTTFKFTVSFKTLLKRHLLCEALFFLCPPVFSPLSAVTFQGSVSETSQEMTFYSSLQLYFVPLTAESSRLRLFEWTTLSPLQDNRHAACATWNILPASLLPSS